MNGRHLLVLPLLCLCAWGAEKEIELADGRVLRGEVLGEQDGQVLLALKSGEASAKLRVARDQVLAVRDAETGRAGSADEPAAPQASAAAAPNDAVFANLRRLIAEARRETEKELAPPPALDSGYPYPVWQHWPWVFSLDRPVRYGYHHSHFGYRGHHGP